VDKKSGKPKANDNGSIKAKTSHTLNPVPLIYYDNQSKGSIVLRQGNDYGLSNVAASVANLLGYDAAEMWDDSMLEFK
jgi:2,3-bisphosphoglycerate-independent phosphoglycerate mutase